MTSELKQDASIEERLRFYESLDLDIPLKTGPVKIFDKVKNAGTIEQIERIMNFQYEIPVKPTYGAKQVLSAKLSKKFNYPELTPGCFYNWAIAEKRFFGMIKEKFLLRIDVIFYCIDDEDNHARAAYNELLIHGFSSIPILYEHPHLSVKNVANEAMRVFAMCIDEVDWNEYSYVDPSEKEKQLFFDIVNAPPNEIKELLEKNKDI